MASPCRALTFADSFLVSVNFTQVQCPVELSNKTGCVRSDEHELFKADRSGLDEGSKIAVGIVVPVGVIFGALVTLWVITKFQNRRPISQQRSANQNNQPPFEKNDIGITKVYKQHYLELDSSPVEDRGEARPSPKLGKSVLPSPSLGMRHPMFEKTKTELGGSPTSELNGSSSIRETQVERSALLKIQSKQSSRVKRSKQELEGSPTSELSGDAPISEILGKYSKPE